MTRHAQGLHCNRTRTQACWAPSTCPPALRVSPHVQGRRGVRALPLLLGAPTRGQNQPAPSRAFPALRLFVASAAGLILVLSPQLLPFRTMPENHSAEVGTSASPTALRGAQGSSWGVTSHLQGPLFRALGPTTLVSLSRGTCHIWS